MTGIWMSYHFSWTPPRRQVVCGTLQGLPSAHPNSKACFCRGAYLYGMVDVALHEESKEREAPAQEGPLSYRCRDSGQESVHTANDHVIWVKYTIDIQIIYVIYDNLLLWMLIVWTHLNILVMKEMMIHVEGITPSPWCWKKLLLQHHDFQVLSSVMAL